MSLTFSKPKVQSDGDRPLALSNKGFPYQNLSDHRRFEELVYSIYRQEINGGSLQHEFDNILLLQGVRERGRDCVLYRSNRIVGIIQCKHSVIQAHRISRPECIREILKFILHAITDTTLIPDANNFTYVMTVSTGLTEPAQLLFSDFSNEIKKETGIQKWCENIIGSNESLKELEYGKIATNLFTILSSIRTKTLLPLELDLLLNKQSNSYIISLFFEVKHIGSMPDSADLPVSQAATSAASGSSNLGVDKILENFRQASYHLENYLTEFEGVKHSHIRRGEVDQLFTWIISSTQEREEPEEQDLPVALLAGNAGVGKTVIMKDLMLTLREHTIPVLGIKSDRVYAKSIRELEEKLDLNDSFENLFNKLNQEYDKMVVLIDQIDALSQSVSINREYLDTFVKLVYKLSRMEGVRIVISCRSYDLNYDNDLKFYKNQKIFNVNLLEKQEVIHILKQLGVNEQSVHGQLIEFLRTPNHLNVFCKIFNKAAGFHEFRSLNDLYHQLWKDKIISPPQPSLVTGVTCKQLVCNVAEKMYSDQRIVTSTLPFTDQFSRELQYLKSNGILIESNDEIQFFHQTFYNYAFSKSFLELKKPLPEYIVENNQGLHVRISLRMITGFLKEDDFNKYLAAFNEILFGDLLFRRLRKSVHRITRLLKNFTNVIKAILHLISVVTNTVELRIGLEELKMMVMPTKYRIHIKFLLLELLGLEKTLTQKEKKLVRKILAHPQYGPVFLDSASSHASFAFIIEEGLLEKLLPPYSWVDRVCNSRTVNRYGLADAAIKFIFRYNRRHHKQEDRLNLCFRVLSKRLPEEREAVVNFLLQCREFKFKHTFVIRVLYFMKTWDKATAFRLFEKYNQYLPEERHYFYHILEDAAAFDPVWVIKIYRSVALKKVEEIVGPNYDPDFKYEDYGIFEKIFEQHKESAFEFTLELVNAISAKTRSPYIEREIYSDLTFHMFEFDPTEHSHTTDGILQLLISEARDLARQQSEKFSNFVSSTVGSKSETLLLILMHGLSFNPQPYIHAIFDLITNLKSYGFFTYDARLHGVFRKLLSVSYQYFTASQKVDVDNIILNLQFLEELRIWKDDEGKKRHYLHHSGHTKLMYLKAIPKDDVKKRPHLLRALQELERKFPDAEAEARKRHRGGMVGPPLDPKAYEKMSLDQWEQSFIKYNSTYRGNPWELKGNMHQHTREFEAEVSKRPTYFFPLIQKLVNEKKYEFSYTIHGMRGLRAAQYNFVEFNKLLKKLMAEDHDTENTRYLIWLTDHLIDTKSIDHDVIEYLCKMAVSHPDPEQDRHSDELVGHGINTVRGAAADRVADLWFVDKEFKELIFSTLEKVTEDKTLCVRASIMPRLAYLMNLDEQRAVELFLKATRHPIPEVFEHTTWSANWLARRHFADLKDYFIEGIKMDRIRPALAEILAVAWINGEDGSKELLEGALKNHPTAQGKMVEIALHFIKEEGLSDKKEKAIELFKRYLNKQEQEIVNEYSVAFLSLTPENFEPIFPLLKLYCKSAIAKRSPHYFFEYLLTCSKRYPKECLTLLSSFKRYEKPDITQSGHYEDEPVKVLLGAYNSLKSSSRLEPYWINRSMKLFDSILLDERFQKTASKALMEVEQ